MKTMKRFMIYAVAACMAGGSFVACTPEEDDLFGQSSAERLGATIPQYTDLLCSAPNGWAMEYFVNNDWESGYTYLMKFGKDTSVKMAADNVWIGGKYTESTSVFEVITDDGPVLTFNTYNPIFHLFATPDNVIGNGAPTDPDNPSSDLDESGYGHRGDYEFVVMKATNDLITLRGKKWGQTILMHRMAEGVSWEDYLAALAETKTHLFAAKAPEVVLTASGERYVVANASSGSISFYPENGDALTETTKVPYIVTKDGIRFVKPFKGKDDKGNFAVQTFRIDENGLVCTDGGQQATIRAYTPSKWLTDRSKSWVLDADELGGWFDEGYKAFAAGVRPKYKALRFMRLTYDRATGAFAFNWRTTNYTGNRYGTLEVDENQVAHITFSGEGDKNGNTMYDNVPAIGEFLNKLQETGYKVDYVHALDASRIKFTSMANADDYFYVTLE